MKIVLNKTADKQLLRLPKYAHSAIIAKIYQLLSPPANLNIKKLADKDRYRLRVGDYRVIYSLNNRLQEIIIHSVAHRKDAYR